MNPISQLLVKHSSQISFDDEPEIYILTKDEEWRVIENEVERLEKFYAWKLYDKGVNSQTEILSKLDNVDLAGKIDVYGLLERANSNKHYGIWQENQRVAERLEAERKQSEICSTWNRGRFFKLIKWASEAEYGKPLIVNDDTLSLIKPLCYFLSEDERFESELGLSLKKGLVFRGVSGIGKTHIVKCASKNERHPICILSMLEIASEVMHEGEYDLPKGFSKFYLDDVGSEEHIQNHYGTKINWFKNFIETFYLRTNQYNRLILSTNNTAREIEEKYGFRVRSRFKDMFNIIDVTGKDLRG